MATVSTSEDSEAAAAPTVGVLNPDGTSPAVLVCEHASNDIPPEFGDLGLDAAILQSHIAWDPGAMAVATELSEILDAALVHQRVSRLLYDCNRPPEAASAIPAKSEIFDIPGNAGLDEAAKARRIALFYRPFQHMLGSFLDARMAQNRAPVIVTIHSFTPVFEGKNRGVGIGVLHDADTRLADAMLAALRHTDGIEIARNQPYGPKDGVTHTLVEHGLSRGVLNVMIEIRNNLISGNSEQKAMARRIATALTSALGTLHVATADAQHKRLRQG